MKQTERLLGLHVRLKQDLFEVINFAQRLKVTAVQSFLINEDGKYVKLSSDVVSEFVHLKKKLACAYFVHAAYWSSLVNVKSKEFITLCEEAQFASNLHSDGIVIHVGATRVKLDKKDQVKYVAECVNTLIAKVSNVPLILENAPHAGRNFGGDITDFGLLYEQIDHKDRVKFCLDTAHAFVYGYDLKNQMKLDDFLKVITEMIGKNNIALLHLNDAPEPCGSYIDKHAVPGEGLLREQVLKQIMKNNLFVDSPIILELPSSSQEEELKILQMIQHWDAV
ncbi:deoxyribonuclease IV [Candidatus Babeliales bacterium]|nr:deoxyribonuclease IV [Candidatus Babeliales bacterium]